MKTLSKSLALSLPLLFAACVTGNDRVDATTNLAFAPVQDGEAQNPMEDPEFMAGWMRSMTPGEQHAQMAELVGTWDINATVWMTPGGETADMVSVAEAEMILGGRYYVERSKGTLMGMPFEGQLTMGYNNVTEEWWSIWIDSMSTGYAAAAGPEQEDGSVSLSGQMIDFVSPEGRPFRTVTNFTEDGRLLMDMYDTAPDGAEWKVMEMVYTRVQE